MVWDLTDGERHEQHVLVHRWNGAGNGSPTKLAGRGGGVGWAQLAADIGYADQAHLVRDFTTPPAAYVRAARG